MLECRVKYHDRFEIRKVRCVHCDKLGLRRIVRPNNNSIVDRLVCSNCDTYNSIDNIDIFDYTHKSEKLRIAYLTKK